MLLLPEPEQYTKCCVICQDVFTAVRRYAHHMQRETCSPRCQARLTVLRRESGDSDTHQQEVPCPECGTVFISEWMREARRYRGYCSTPCARRANAKKRQTESWIKEQLVACEVCKKEFLAMRRSKKQGFARTCSFECRGVLTRSSMKRQCSTCGKIFRQVRSVVERGGRGGCFCSQECYHQNGHQERVVGRKIDKGYVLVYQPDHPYIDGNRSNNGRDNLELWIRGQPAGQRLKDLYTPEFERLLHENATLKQRLAVYEAL